MKTIKTNSMKKFEKHEGKLIPLAAFFMFVVLAVFTTKPAVAHCDSYDGPVITDARHALETNNVELVLKWINKSQENEIRALFEKTVNLKNSDDEIYQIVEKHFLETLVRLHRETEGAPYTGLKPAGTTKPIIMLTDQAISSGDIENLLTKLNNHIGQVIDEKYKKVQELNKVKNESAERGREYVHAYVDYTHTVEAVHDIVEHGAGEHAVH